MRSIHTETTINCSPASLSSIIFDFNNYHKWSKWSISGPEVTSKSTFYLSLIGAELEVSETDTYRPIIRIASPSVLKWTFGHREHYFEIVSVEDSSQRCVFRHGEVFSGVMWKRKKWYKQRKDEFEAFNSELKVLAESKELVELVSRS